MTEVNARGVEISYAYGQKSRIEISWKSREMSEKGKSEIKLPCARRSSALRQCQCHTEEMRLSSSYTVQKVSVWKSEMQAEVDDSSLICSHSHFAFLQSVSLHDRLHS